MRKLAWPKRTPIILAFIQLLSLSLSFGQLGLGKATLLPAAGYSIPKALSVSSICSTPRLASRIGGVAFDKVAIPSKVQGKVVTSLRLDYLPQEADGNRATLEINGLPIKWAAYDHLMIPSAVFANSDNVAAFTLFGTLGDPNKDREVIVERKGHVLGYHPAFENTYAGLMLFLMDILIIDENAIHPITMKEEPIHANGDSKVDWVSNQRALYDLHLDYSISGVQWDCQSYLISDRDQSIEFSWMNGNLELTGRPKYFFWSQIANETIIERKQLSDFFNSRWELVRSVNPLVYDSVRKIMQYTAFFRYVKLNYPQIFHNFLLKVKMVRTSPKVETSRIYYPE